MRSLLAREIKGGVRACWASQASRFRVLLTDQRISFQSFGNVSNSVLDPNRHGSPRQ